MTATVVRIGGREPVTLEQHVAAEIRAQMARLDVTQIALAQALRLSNSELSRRLGGDRPIKLGFVEEVCRALNMNPRTLFDWTPPDDGPASAPTRKQTAVSRHKPSLVAVAA